MNPNDYQVLVKQCGSFGVYKSDSAYWADRSLVKVVCPAQSSDLIPEVVRKLTDIQLALTPINHNSIYAVKCREGTLPGVKHKIIDVFTVVEKSTHDAVVDWIENNCNSIQIPNPSENFDTSKLSVGPCAYLDSDGHRYVKVRFDGVSIPFYIINDKWESSMTTDALTKQSGPALADKFTNILGQYEATILERAKERKLNKSGIPEYAQHHITYWVEIPNGVFQRVKEDSPYMSAPGTKIYPVCAYGYQYKGRKLNDFALIDDVLYNVLGYYAKREVWATTPNYSNNYQGVKLKYDLQDYNKSLFGEERSVSTYHDNYYVFTRADMVKVDDDDTFVKEKVIRTLKVKL